MPLDRPGRHLAGDEETYYQSRKEPDTPGREGFDSQAARQALGQTPPTRPATLIGHLKTEFLNGLPATVRALVSGIVFLTLLGLVLIVPWGRISPFADPGEAEQNATPTPDEAAGLPIPLNGLSAEDSLHTAFIENLILNSGEVYYLGDPIPMAVVSQSDQVEYTLEWVFADQEDVIGETYQGVGTVHDVPGAGRIAFLPTSMLAKKGVYYLSGEGFYRRRILIVDPLPDIQNPALWRFGLQTSFERIEHGGADLAEELYRVGVMWAPFEIPIARLLELGGADPTAGGQISPQFEAFINRANEIGLQPIVLLRASHDDIPQPDDAGSPFYLGVQTAQGYYAGKLRYWGLSQETAPGSEISGFTPDQYANVLIHFSQALKTVDPQVRVIAGELARADQAHFRQALLREEVLPHWDILSTHHLAAGLAGGENSGLIEYANQLGDNLRPIWETEGPGSLYGGPSTPDSLMLSRFPIESSEDLQTGINKWMARSLCLEVPQNDTWLPAFYAPEASCLGSDLFIGFHYNASWEPAWSLRTRWDNDTAQEGAQNHKVANFRAAADMLFGAQAISRIPNMDQPDPYNAQPGDRYTRADGYIFSYGPEWIIALWQNSGTSNQDQELILSTNDPIVLFDSFGNRSPLRMEQGQVKVWLSSEVIYLRGFTSMPTFTEDTTRDDEPYFVTTPLTQAQVGRRYSYNAWAYDPDPPQEGNDSLPRIRYELINGPPGMTLASNQTDSNFARRTALLDWYPEEPGTFPVTLRAVSEHGEPKSVEQSFNVEVAAADAQLPPTINSHPPTTFAQTGIPWWYNLYAHDLSGLAVRYSLIQAPQGMTIDEARGTIQWFPNQPGTFQVSVNASNGFANANQTFHIRVGGDPLAPAVFADVPLDHWARSHIESLYQAGYLSGCGADPLTFCPEATLTRAEGAVLISRGVYGVEHIPAAPAAQLFSDVAPDHWVAKWASELYEAGYLSGCSSDPPAFCPDSGLNRTEGAVFFLRMLNGPDYDPPAASGIFEDVAPDFWGARWIEAAYDQGLIQTCGDNGTLQICPLDPLTRASAAYMLAQAKNLVQ